VQERDCNGDVSVEHLEQDSGRGRADGDAKNGDCREVVVEQQGINATELGSLSGSEAEAPEGENPKTRRSKTFQRTKEEAVDAEAASLRTQRSVGTEGEMAAGGQGGRSTDNSTGVEGRSSLAESSSVGEKNEANTRVALQVEFTLLLVVLRDGCDARAHEDIGSCKCPSAWSSNARSFPHGKRKKQNKTKQNKTECCMTEVQGGLPLPLSVSFSDAWPRGGPMENPFGQW